VGFLLKIRKTLILFCLGFLTLLEFYTMRKMKSAERPKKNFFPFFFSFCYNSCWGIRILLKFCVSNLGDVFQIWCKRLDLFWSVWGLTSKMQTYPICQLAPLSLTCTVCPPTSNYYCKDNKIKGEQRYSRPSQKKLRTTTLLAIL
jgi:hypothetical protein